jgi:hypothetical protein
MPIRFAAGLDDTATVTQQCEGWSSIIMQESAAACFESQAKALLPAGVNEFHGKKWKPAFDSEYRQFLQLIRQSLDSDPHSRAFSSLNSLGWKGDFLPFCEKVVREKCSASGISDAQFVTVLSKLFPPLATFQRLLRKGLAGSEVRFSIDADDTFKLFPSLKAIVNGQTIEAESMLASVYNDYRFARFPSSPVLVNPGVEICRGSKSFLIQATDVIGNFSLAYVYAQAGKASSRVAQKAKSYSDVFGDILDDAILAAGCTFVGDELRLRQEGALTLTMK